MLRLGLMPLRAPSFPAIVHDIVHGPRGALTPMFSLRSRELMKLRDIHPAPPPPHSSKAVRLFGVVGEGGRVTLLKPKPRP